MGQIHYVGKWERVGPWKWRVFWAPLNDIEPIGEKINERLLSYRQQADFYAKFIKKREVFEKSAVSTNFLRKVHIFDKCAMILLYEPKRNGPAFAKSPDFGKPACIMRKLQILFIISVVFILTSCLIMLYYVINICTKPLGFDS